VLVVLALLGVVFRPGEKLEYDVRYGPVVLGGLVLRTLPVETVAGTECYHFRAELEINRSLSWLFWASYQLETWCDTKELITRRSRKRTREPNYRAEWTADYYQDEQRVIYSDSNEYQAPDSARDLLTLWYYLRTRPLEPGTVVVLNGHIDRKNYRLQARVTDYGVVRTGAGRFDCLAVSPSAAGPLGAVLVSRDSCHLPVVLRTRVAGLVVSAFLRRITSQEE